MEQKKIDLSELRERFSVEPEQVAKEILECPHEALGDEVVLVPYQPNYQTKIKNLVLMDGEDEPNNKKVPQGWVLSVGESAKKLLGIKEGDLVKYAGVSQHDYTNGKVYLIMHRINIKTRLHLDKVIEWR